MSFCWSQVVLKPASGAFLLKTLGLKSFSRISLNNNIPWSSRCLPATIARSLRVSPIAREVDHSWLSGEVTRDKSKGRRAYELEPVGVAARRASATESVLIVEQAAAIRRPIHCRRYYCWKVGGWLAEEEESHDVEPFRSTNTESEVAAARMVGQAKPLMFQVVVAATQQLGIGFKGGLPWRLPADLKFFKDLTSATDGAAKKNAVIMGRKTWESLPPKFRPLPGRLNVVLSRSTAVDLPDGVLLCGGLQAALSLLASPAYAPTLSSVFVIGGGEIFKEALASPLCAAVHLTEVEGEFECDTFIPAPDPAAYKLWCASEPRANNGIRHSFTTYVRAPEATRGASPEDATACEPASVLPPSVRERHEEYQYLRMVEDIIQSGTVKGDRTGTGTISRFGCQMRFNLRKSFPLLTTKRVFWRGVAEELLWFVSGCTNAKLLHDKGIGIWDGNGSREYLDSIGLKDRAEWDLGPVYGFQWRHFGAKYVDMHTDYRGQGVDQLADVIHKIKTTPDDRRIIMSAWNPADLGLMALPPCHMFCQFYVANGELSCQMYQRSCDMGLGVPFNIASYSLLTCMLAQVCRLKPGDFVHVLGDAHVYSNHVEPLQEQLKNTPRPFPVLRINPAKMDIDSFTMDDFELVGYNPHKKIAMQMAV